MAEEFIRATEKWYTQYRNWIMIVNVLAFIGYAVFKIDLTQIQQEHLAKALSDNMSGIIFIISTILSYASRAKSQKKAQRKRKSDMTPVDRLTQM